MTSDLFNSIDSRVQHGDCLQLLPQLPMMDLIFADPPFNIGVKYAACDDKRPDAEFAAWVFAWLDLAWAKTKGVLCVHGPDRLADLYVLWANARGVLSHRIAWVNWWYNFGNNTKGNWVDARCHCMVFATQPKQHTWNPEDVLVESFRSSRYADKRIYESSLAGKRVPGTVWGGDADGQYWGRVQGNSQERVPEQPNQLPEVYLERLIRAYTNPGDTVLDPFGGTGTTITVAETLGRVGFTIELDAVACERIRERVKKGAIRVKPVKGSS